MKFKNILTILIFSVTCLFCFFTTSCDNGNKNPEKYKLILKVNDEEIISEYEKGSTIDLTTLNPEVDGYEFERWYMDESCVIPADDLIIIISDTTRYAKMKKIEIIEPIIETSSINIYIDDVFYEEIEIEREKNLNFSRLISEKTKINISDITSWEQFINNKKEKFNPESFSIIKEKYDIYLSTKVAVEEIKYNITIYYLNNYETKTFVKNTKLNLSELIPQVSGYTFEGWFADSTYVTKLNNEYVVTKDAAIYVRFGDGKFTLTVKWPDEKKYNLQYGETITLTNCEKEIKGYEFEGFYFDEDYLKKCPGKITMDNDVIIYPKLKTKQFDLNINFFDKTITETFEYKQNVNLNEYIPKLEGYEFKGWFLDKDFLIKASEEFKISKNTNIYAKYEINKYKLSIIYDNKKSELSFEYNENIILEDVIPNHEHHTFEGWYYDSEFTEKITVSNIAIKESLTLYAKFSINECTLIIYGFENNKKEFSFKYNTQIDLGNYVENISGYKIEGVYEDSEYTKKFENRSFGIKSDLTLYFKYIVKKYTLTINYLDNADTYEFEHGTKINLNDYAKQLEHYTYLAMYSDSNFENEITENIITLNSNKNIYLKYLITKG